MIAPVTHILPLTQIRRSRMLPVKGRVLVRVGQKVNASDVVAEADMPGAHVIIDVRRIFGIRRPEQLVQVIERKAGDHVEMGDILAQTGGILSRVIRAPASGKVIAIHRGQVILEKTGNRLELKAGLNGVISEVLPERGVIVEANGALIQGAWGNGKINLGMLNFMLKSPDEELTRSNLDVTARGSVVIAGYVSQADTLQAADELILRGLVLSSMSSSLVDMALKVSYPIVLIEGFGRSPLNSAAYRLLSAHDKRDVSIDASWNPNRSERPEIFVPLPSNGVAPKEAIEFAIGQTIRVIAPPYTGQIGSISTFHPGQTRLPNGLRTSAAEVELETGQFVTVPLANLDVLE